MTRRLVVLLLLLLLLTPGRSWAASVEAFVDRTRVTIDDVLALTVRIDGDGGEVDVSAIEDFQVRRAGSSTNVSIINGKMTKTVSHQFALTPKRTGNLVIPPLAVKTDDRTLRTKEIRVQVAQSRPPDSGQGDVFLTAEVGRTDPYIGQPVVYSLKVYQAVEFMNAALEQRNFEGFTVMRLPSREPVMTSVEGRRYRLTELRWLLTPLSAGAIILDPDVLRADVVSRGRWVSKAYRSRPVELTVRPLPPYPGNDRFSGLIGVFDIRAGLDKDTAGVGESVTFSVTIEGAGNIMDAGEPAFPAPPDFKVYQDQPEEDVKPGDRTHAGHKTFRWALVPMKPGVARIPPLSLTYFDPDQGEYVTKTTGAYALHVTPPADGEPVPAIAPPDDASAEVKKRKVEYLEKDILPIAVDLRALDDQAPLSPLVFVLLLALPAAAYGIARGVLRLIGRERDASRLLVERARAAVKTAGEATGAEALSQCARALTAALCSREGRPAESLTYAEAEELASACGLGNDEVEGVRDLMKRIDAARYGGEAGSRDVEALVAETRTLVRKLCS